MIRYVRYFLLPFSLLYGLGILLRNLAYRTGLFASTSFQMPVILVGNLAVGGAGKSPMTEYLVKLFKKDYNLAVLSRGYGRKTKGFRLVNIQDSIADSGDEPLQFKQHFPDQTIAVCEDRVFGIKQLKPNHNLILLDDAYQHRALKPSFQILLIEYSSLYKLDFLLPAGNMREPMCAKNRADIIVVTKSPRSLSSSEKLSVRKQLKPKAHQALFFAHLRYDDLIPLREGASRKLTTINAQTAILLITGIANPDPLKEELNRYSATLLHHDYPDHHVFTRKNMLKLAAEFEQLTARDKIIVTTEKDAQRLRSPELAAKLAYLPIYVVPVAADFEEPDKEDFDHLLKQHAREHTYNH